VDVVIDPTAEQLAAFLDSLGDEVYANRTTAEYALRTRAMFNIIVSGNKADLIVRKERPFSVEEFRRRCLVRMLDVSLYLASPEDVILSKLEWAKEGDSERQFRDALGVAVVQWEKLDTEYLRRWAPELGVGDPLEQLLGEAGEQAPKP
jgi:hypothetical protein